MKKRSFKNRMGRCYEIAMKFVTDNPSAKIFHGIINGKEGRIYHAWNEIEGKIYDPVSNRLYSPRNYEIAFKPIILKEYTSEQAIIENLRSGHYGPYHETPE